MYNGDWMTAGTRTVPEFIITMILLVFFILLFGMCLSGAISRKSRASMAVSVAAPFIMINLSLITFKLLFDHAPVFGDLVKYELLAVLFGIVTGAFLCYMRYLHQENLGEEIASGTGKKGDSVPVYDMEDALDFVNERCDAGRDLIEKILLLEEDYMRSVGIIDEISNLGGE